MQSIIRESELTKSRQQALAQFQIQSQATDQVELLEVGLKKQKLDSQQKEYHYNSYYKEQHEELSEKENVGGGKQSNSKKIKKSKKKSPKEPSSNSSSAVKKKAHQRKKRQVLIQRHNSEYITRQESSITQQILSQPQNYSDNKEVTNNNNYFASQKQQFGGEVSCFEVQTPIQNQFKQLNQQVQYSQPSSHWNCGFEEISNQQYETRNLEFYKQIQQIYNQNNSNYSFHHHQHQNNGNNNYQQNLDSDEKQSNYTNLLNSNRSNFSKNSITEGSQLSNQDSFIFECNENLSQRIMNIDIPCYGEKSDTKQREIYHSDSRKNHSDQEETSDDDNDDEYDNEEECNSNEFSGSQSEQSKEVFNSQMQKEEAGACYQQNNNNNNNKKFGDKMIQEDQEIVPMSQEQEPQLSSQQSQQQMIQEPEIYRTQYYQGESEINQNQQHQEEDEYAFSPTFSQDTLLFMVEIENDYIPDYQYIENNQKNMDWRMRAILIDWIMEVCMEFALKRETFHIAINLLDRFLSVHHHVPKTQLQLIGLTAMFLAAKQEEIYPPQLAKFLQSAADGYTTKQVTDMEMLILRKLKFLTNPPTLNIWGNWLMTEWDIYIENSQYALSHPLILQKLQFQDTPVQFKMPNEQSYVMYREYCQFVDTIMLDNQTLQYKPRALLAAIMYLCLGKQYQAFSVKDIIDNFPSSSMFLISDNNLFNSLFADFLNYTLGFQLIELLPTIQYASTFFHMPVCVEIPTAAKLNQENVLVGHFEEFLSFQTHNTNALQSIKQRNRNIII